MSPKDENGMANSVDPDQTAPLAFIISDKTNDYKVVGTMFWIHLTANTCSYEPRHKKTRLRGLRPAKIKTGLLSHRLARVLKFRI